MEQEDYLKRQIDQFGRVLGKILSDLLRLTNKGKTGLGIEITNQILKNESALNIQELIDLKTDNFIITLTSGKNFTNTNLAQLAEIFLLLADNKQDEDRKNIYLKCLRIYDYLEEAEKTYSLDRQMKIAHIKNML